MMQRDLSEPYPIWTYRYFLHQWPELCLLIELDGKIIGSVVSKLDVNKKNGPTGQKMFTKRGYIAMLSVEPEYRRIGLGKLMVKRTIELMVQQQADEVMLETEITNLAALRLYEYFGFIRDKRLTAYYLNGVDAYRLKLIITPNLDGRIIPERPRPQVKQASACQKGCC